MNQFFLFERYIILFFVASARNWTVENKESYKISHSPFVLCVEAVDLEKNSTPSKESNRVKDLQSHSVTQVSSSLTSKLAQQMRRHFSFSFVHLKLLQKDIGSVV